MYNYWGGKSVYYSLIDKVGSKHVLKEDNVIPFTPPSGADEDEDSCTACKL